MWKIFFFCLPKDTETDHKAPQRIAHWAGATRRASGGRLLAEERVGGSTNIPNQLRNKGKGGTKAARAHRCSCSCRCCCCSCCCPAGHPGPHKGHHARQKDHPQHQEEPHQPERVRDDVHKAHLLQDAEGGGHRAPICARGTHARAQCSQREEQSGSKWGWGGGNCAHQREWAPSPIEKSAPHRWRREHRPRTW